MKKNTFITNCNPIVRFNSLFLMSLLFLGLLIFSAIGCKKEDELEDGEARMHGRVIEKGSNKPVKGATVYISSSKCQFLGGCSGEVIDSATTDASGVYDFTYKFKGQFGNSFDISVRVPKGYWGETSIVALAPNTHEILNYDIVIQPLTWVKVHVKDTKVGNESYIQIYGLTGITYSFAGKNIDTTFVITKLALDTVRAVGYYTENLIEKQVRDKAYCKPLETVSIKLFY